MKNNIFIKLLCSIPVILVLLYFIPSLGVCLILFRYFIYKRNKYYSIPITLIICGLLIVVPQAINTIIKMLKINSVEIPYLNTIITSNIYIKLLSYSKMLITIGVIFFILSFIFRNVFEKISNKLNSGIKDYIEKDLQKDYEIRKENDLKMQEKREKSKNTHVVHCPYCGSDNMLTEQTGTCKFCRRKIEYKN